MDMDKPGMSKPACGPTRMLISVPSTKTIQAPLCTDCYNFNGNMFDIKAKNSVSIRSLMLYVARGAIAEVWTKVGTHVGFEVSSTRWKKVAGK
jgi:hypothetical protein